MIPEIPVISTKKSVSPPSEPFKGMVDGFSIRILPEKGFLTKSSPEKNFDILSLPLMEDFIDCLLP